MCGIVGKVGTTPVLPNLLTSLKRLEYRGYDSAGVAILENGAIAVRKCPGKIRDLEHLLQKEKLSGTLGIAHTRWATHGRPTRRNAHPHRDCKGRLALVHNGIIENFTEIREKLKKAGHTFSSSTDTEVIVHAIEAELKKSGNLQKAIEASLRTFRGAYGFVLLAEDEPDRLYFARLGSPLVAGKVADGIMLASDIPALLPFTQAIASVNNGEWGFCTREKLHMVNASGAEVHRKFHPVSLTLDQAEKGGYPHFMLKEIFEQPQALAQTLALHIRQQKVAVCYQLPSSQTSGESATPQWLKKSQRFFFVACGTAYHAGLTATYFFENLLPQPCRAEIASEFRYRSLKLKKSDTLILISQSGETADTLAALRKAKEAGSRVLAICNVPGSTLAAEADALFCTRAGPEIGVASTKAYTAQIAACHLIALDLAKQSLSSSAARRAAAALLRLPDQIRQVLGQEKALFRIAERFQRHTHFLYLGRHIFYPQALEGALKLKEISYVHAEGYPAGEMKHGPIALIDKTMPIIAIAPRASTYEKTISNLKEVEARNGKIIAIGTQGDQALQRLATGFLSIPEAPEWLAPLLVAPHLQLFAYAIAKLHGREIDQPRNLAKSVTVE